MPKINYAYIPFFLFEKKTRYPMSYKLQQLFNPMSELSPAATTLSECVDPDYVLYRTSDSWETEPNLLS